MTKSAKNAHRHPKRVTSSDVRASFDPSGAQEPLLFAYFGRPLSHLCTAPLYNWGWSADGVTYLRVVIAVLALVGLGSGNSVALVGAAAAFYVHLILDCVDGNLARLTDSASYWGKFIDGIADGAYYLFAPLAVGIGLWHTSDSSWALLIGVATTAIALYCEMIRNRRSFFRAWMVAETGPLTSEEEKAYGTIAILEKRLAAAHFNGTSLAPVVLFLPGGGEYYLWCLVVLQGLGAVVWLTLLFFQANAVLGRGRKSVHARLAK